MTNSKIHRRSGKSVCEICELIGWHPDVVIQCGIGPYYGEVFEFRDRWPNVEFIGIEANPKVAQGLVGRYPGKIIEAVVGSKEDHTAIYHRKLHKAGSSIFQTPGADHSYIQPVRALDAILSDAHPFSDSNTLLWLDCEGSELEALRGGSQILRRTEMVNVEMTGSRPHEDWPRPVEIHSVLRESGFLCQWTHTHRSCIGQFDAIYVRPQLFREEFCNCPLQVEMLQ